MFNIDKVETSSEVYRELAEKYAATKGKVTLDNLRVCCDHIVEHKILMSYSAVPRVAKSLKLVGGPAHSTVQGNSDWKRYIAARKREYESSKIAKTVSRNVDPKDPSILNVSEKYPEDGLSPIVRECIDTLRTRLKAQTNLANTFKRNYEKATRQNPVDIGAAIEQGPSAALALQIELKDSLSDDVETLRHSIEKILDLITNESYGFVVRTRGYKSIIEHEEYGWYLSHEEYQSLREFIQLSNGV